MYTGISSEYQSAINKNIRRFTARIRKDNQMLDVQIKSYSLNRYSSSGEDYTLGCAFSASVGMTYITDGILKNQEISLETGLHVESGTEYVPDGMFTILTEKEKAGVITATGYDRMYVYGSKIFEVKQFPDTLSNMAAEVAKQLGTIFDTSCMSSADDLQVTTMPENCTLQNLAGYLAGLLGRNAYIDRSGKLTFKAYTDSDFSFDGSRISDIDLDQTARTINCLKCTAGEDSDVLQSGSGNGYITIQNPLMTQTILDRMAAKISGFAYYGAVVPFLLGDNRLDPWDIITYNKNGKTYPILCHEIITSFDGGLQMNVTSYALSESEQNGYKGPLQQAVEELKKQTVDSVKSASIIADTYVFKYNSSGVLTGAAQANLTAQVQNVIVDRWQYLNISGEWENYPVSEDNPSITELELIVKPEHSVFVNDTAQIKLLTSNSTVYDTVTVTKLYDGKEGPKGNKGEDGTSVTIKGSVDSTDNLPTSGNTAGDGYIINGDLYVWDGEKWNNVGAIQGPAGDSAYMHIKYSDDGGKTFTSNNGEDPGQYVGVYADHTEADSTNPADYTWSKIEGEDGTGGLSVILGNEAQTISCSSDGKVLEDILVEIPFIGYVGTDQVACSCTVGSLPSGVTLNKNQAATVSASGLVVLKFVKDSTLGGTENGTLELTFTIESKTVKKTFSWSKSNSGADGTDGKNGKTLYTWIKYADTPTTGMSDNPDGKAYIGIAYNKETQTESTNYSDYTWSKTEGKQGVPGEPGEDGTTTYTWIKYADDATGKNMSDDPEGKEYIGMAYNKTTQTESTNAADYTWSKFRGDDGVPGRTYILESDVQVVKKGANDVLSPKSITFSSYYRDGDTAARTAYAGRFKIYESTSDTSTWSLKYTSGSNQSSKTHTISTSSVKYIKCVLYAAGSTSTEITSVTVNVIEDAECAVDQIDKMLTQKEIFNRLTNNGEAQGMYYDESTGDLYINATYIVSGILSSLGGESWINLEDGTFQLKDGLLDSVKFLESINVKSRYGFVLTLFKAIQNSGSSPLMISVDPEKQLEGGIWIYCDSFFKADVQFGANAYFKGLAQFKGTAQFDGVTTHTAPLLQKAGSYIHTAKGTSGSAGYVKVAQIKITATYRNTPIILHVLQRGAPETILAILFKNEDNTNPALQAFTHEGLYPAYLVHSSTGTWDLYIKKTEGYDNICISQYYISPYQADGVTISWIDTHASSLPSGYVASAIYCTGDSGWITISSFLNSFAQASTSWSSTCKYRKIGNRVQVKGCVKSPSSWGGSSTAVFQLPSGYRPASRKYVLSPATGSRIARIYADTAGNLYVEWVKAIADAAAVSGALDWIQIDIDFLVD